MTTKTMASVLYGSVLSASLSLLPASVAIADASGQLELTVQVLASCQVDGDTLDFGTYDGSEDPTGTATITVQCSNWTTLFVGLDGGNTNARQLAGPNGNHLNYGLFQDDEHSVPFGDVGTDRVEVDLASNSAHEIDVYGLIEAEQSVEAGKYDDTVTISVNFM